MSNDVQNKRGEIIIHLLVWLILFVLPYTFTIGAGRAWNELFNFWFIMSLLSIVFYLNYLWLVNRWYFSSRQVYFFASNLVLLVVFISTNYFVADQLRHAPPHEKPPFTARFYIDFLMFLIPVISAIAVRSSKRLLKVELQQKETENLTLESELRNLKYQLQPHFFFNSLNNIYAMVDQAPDKAKQTLHTLSKLMRYLLQSSQVEKVSLADEVAFINQYISLMALRQNASVTIETHFPNNIPDISIAPLLFVSIVENAFKHGVAASKPSWLYFEMKIDADKQITFISKNYLFPKDKSDMSGSGIGIENLRKRLLLMYENNHAFIIDSDNEQFTVTLSVKGT